jgi:Ca-activated chloride channel homolog
MRSPPPAARLKDAEVKSKLVVLLSDGDSNFGIIRPHGRRRAAAALGIRVYTIGIGSTGSAPFPMRDALGRTVIRHVTVTMDEQLLKDIAETTGGQYFDCRNPRALRRALEEIDTLEKTTIDTVVYEQYKEWFARWLIPGLLLTAIGALGQAAASRRVI